MSSPLVLDLRRREFPSFLRNLGEGNLLMALHDKTPFAIIERTLNEIADGQHTLGAYTRGVALRVNYHLGHNNSDVRKAAEKARDRIIRHAPPSLNLQLVFK